MTYEEAISKIEDWASSYSGEFLVGQAERDEHSAELKAVFEAIDKEIETAYDRGVFEATERS